MIRCFSIQCQPANSRFLTIGMLLCLSLTACTTTTIPITPAFDNCGNSVTLSRDHFRGDPGAAVDTISTDEQEISAFVACRNLSGSHMLKWEWYSPDRRMYTSESSPISIMSGSFSRSATAWHTIRIKGDRAERLPGLWQVKVFYDGLPIASASFALKPGSSHDTQVEPPPIKSRLEQIIDSAETVPQTRGVLTK